MDQQPQAHVWPSNDRTRFKKGDCPNPGGRPSVKWLKELIDSEDPETGKTKRQMIAEHLIEVATRWEIKQFGRDIEVASGRDAVDAAKLLFSYCIGKPPAAPEELLLTIAEYFRKVERDRIDLVAAMLGDRVKSMTPRELAEFFEACAKDPRGYLSAAERYIAERESRELSGGGDGGIPGQAPETATAKPQESAGSLPPSSSAVAEPAEVIGEPRPPCSTGSDGAPAVPTEQSSTQESSPDAFSSPLGGDDGPE